MMPAAQAAQRLMHGQDWDGQPIPNIQNWAFSEKLNGCRAYWDGEALYTKSGNPICLPRITQALPAGFSLDGELWCGRGQFETARLATQYGKDHASLRFVAFDAPTLRGDWLQRLDGARSTGVEVVGALMVSSMRQLQALVDQTIDQGGEGLMGIDLSHRHYQPGRAKNLLKFKTHSANTRASQ